MASSKRESFLLRIDPKAWAGVEAWAHQEMRSVNSQIEYILRDAVLRRRKNADLPPPGDGGEKGSFPASPTPVT